MGTITTPSTTELVQRELRGRRTDVPGLLFSGALLLALFVALGVLVVLVVDVLQDAIPTFAERGTDYLTRNPSSRASRAGILGPILGTVLIGGFVVVLSFPIGIASAIYLEEYAPRNAFTRLIDVNIRNLAGVPSIVYGLLGLAIFVKLLAPVTGGRTLMAGGFTIAILVLPIVIITSAEALRSVPASIREAAFGVGATRWEVIRSHVLPYAAPGILTGTILTLARAFGETAPLLLIGGAPGFFTSGAEGVVETLQGPYTALPAIIYTWSRKSIREFGELTAAAIIVLLVILLIVNASAILLRNRYERRW
jgi:phosphate transport system permease protein